MNRFFSSEIQDVYLPPRLYARLDQTEPAEPSGEETTVFAYDAVDADWDCFAIDMPFDLDRISNRRWNWWRRHSPNRREQLEAYERVPLFRFELTVEPGELYEYLAGLGTSWLEFEVSPRGELEVDFYSSLFGPPGIARLARVPRKSKKAGALDVAFGMDLFHDASQSQIENALSGVHSYEQLVVYDVGQGLASAVLDTEGRVAFYFDLGCGVHGNAKTCPTNPLTFCACRAPIILSHWDSDHWAAAAKCQQMLRRTWIAPRQKISAKHKIFAASIERHGTLLVVPHWPPVYSAQSSRGEILRLMRATGSRADRNSSGLVAIVENPAVKRHWLLTGDAGYSYIPGGTTKLNPVAVVVPHHGGDIGPAKATPARAPFPTYSRLLYSFGPDNRHGRTNVRHPTTATVAAHINSGWGHGAWVANSPGFSKAGGDVIATAAHLSTHLDGAVCGWASPPFLPVRKPCARCSTTATIGQS